MVVRPFQQSDAEAVSDVIRETMRVSNSKDYSRERLQPLIDYFSPEKLLRLNGERYCLVAEVDGQIVGTAALEGSDLVTFFVLPRFQRLGIGTRLLRAIEEAAVEKGLDRLKVEASLTGASFYETLGYRRMGVAFEGTAGQQVELCKDL